jgi:hypothetical protein
VAPPSVPLDASRYLPYVVMAALAGTLILVLIRSERFRPLAGALLGAAVFIGLGYAAWLHRHSLAPEDRLRHGVTVVTLLVVAGALAPFLYALFPPAPQARLHLAQAGDHQDVTIRGPANTVVLHASGSFRPDVGESVHTNYRLAVRHAGHEELVEGTFVRSSGTTSVRRGVRGGGSVSESKANRHVLDQLRGTGRYTITLEMVNDTLQPPMRVEVGGEPFSLLVLGLLFGLLAVVVLAVDVALARRGSEPAYAALMLLPLAAVFYLHGHLTRETLPENLLAAGIVGVLAGGLGGELLARLVRSVVPKR